MNYYLYIIILIVFFVIVFKKLFPDDEHFLSYAPYRSRWSSRWNTGWYTPFIWNNPTRYYGYYGYYGYPWYGGVGDYYYDSYRYGLW